MPASANTASNDAVNCPARSEESEPRSAFAEVHHEVAGLLSRPEPVRMGGHAQDVQVAVADLEREQDVESPQA
jgi:hypothetical protein